jgi:formate hydrogenlyase subunit 6/NADH:ubiquinone oxidoreductase subunit I
MEYFSTNAMHWNMFYNKNMLPHLEITSTCIACDNCKIICPEFSISSYDNHYFIDTWSCTLCHICVEICPVDAIKLAKDFE